MCTSSSCGWVEFSGTLWRAVKCPSWQNGTQKRILLVMWLNQRSKYDKNVSPNWKPVAGLSTRKPGMMWSDRIWHWLVSLGGIAIAGCGVAVMAYLHLGRTGGLIVGLGIGVFLFGFPSQAQRNGYRE